LDRDFFSFFYFGKLNAKEYEVGKNATNQYEYFVCFFLWMSRSAKSQSFWSTLNRDLTLIHRKSIAYSVNSCGVFLHGIIERLKIGGVFDKIKEVGKMLILI
jgi:hypothetical protein